MEENNKNNEKAKLLGDESQKTSTPSLAEIRQARKEYDRDSAKHVKAINSLATNEQLDAQEYERQLKEELQKLQKLEFEFIQKVHPDNTGPVRQVVLAGSENKPYTSSALYNSSNAQMYESSHSALAEVERAIPREILRQGAYGSLQEQDLESSKNDRFAAIYRIVLNLEENPPQPQDLTKTPKSSPNELPAANLSTAAVEADPHSDSDEAKTFIPSEMPRSDSDVLLLSESNTPIESIFVPLSKQTSKAFFNTIDNKNDPGIAPDEIRTAWVMADETLYSLTKFNRAPNGRLKIQTKRKWPLGLLTAGLSIAAGAGFFLLTFFGPIPIFPVLIAIMASVFLSSFVHELRNGLMRRPKWFDSSWASIFSIATLGLGIGISYFAAGPIVSAGSTVFFTVFFAFTLAALSYFALISYRKFKIDHREFLDSPWMLLALIGICAAIACIAYIPAVAGLLGGLSIAGTFSIWALTGITAGVAALAAFIAYEMVEPFFRESNITGGAKLNESFNKDLEQITRELSALVNHPIILDSSDSPMDFFNFQNWCGNFLNARNEYKKLLTFIKNNRITIDDSLNTEIQRLTTIMDSPVLKEKIKDAELLEAFLLPEAEYFQIAPYPKLKEILGNIRDSSLKDRTKKLQIILSLVNRKSSLVANFASGKTLHPKVWKLFIEGIHNCQKENFDVEEVIQEVINEVQKKIPKNQENKSGAELEQIEGILSETHMFKLLMELQRNQNDDNEAPYLERVNSIITQAKNIAGPISENNENGHDQKDSELHVFIEEILRNAIPDQPEEKKSSELLVKQFAVIDLFFRKQRLLKQIQGVLNNEPIACELIDQCLENFEEAAKFCAKQGLDVKEVVQELKQSIKNVFKEKGGSLSAGAKGSLQRTVDCADGLIFHYTEFVVLNLQESLKALIKEKPSLDNKEVYLKKITDIITKAEAAITFWDPEALKVLNKISPTSNVDQGEEKNSKDFLIKKQDVLFTKIDLIFKKQKLLDALVHGNKTIITALSAFDKALMLCQEKDVFAVNMLQDVSSCIKQTCQNFDQNQAQLKETLLYQIDEITVHFLDRQRKRLEKVAAKTKKKLNRKAPKIDHASSHLQETKDLVDEAELATKNFKSQMDEKNQDSASSNLEKILNKILLNQESTQGFQIKKFEIINLTFVTEVLLKQIQRIPNGKMTSDQLDQSLKNFSQAVKFCGALDVDVKDIINIVMSFIQDKTNNKDLLINQENLFTIALNHISVISLSYLGRVMDKEKQSLAVIENVSPSIEQIKKAVEQAEQIIQRFTLQSEEKLIIQQGPNVTLDNKTSSLSEDEQKNEEPTRDSLVKKFAGMNFILKKRILLNQLKLLKHSKLEQTNLLDIQKSLADFELSIIFCQEQGLDIEEIARIYITEFQIILKLKFQNIIEKQENLKDPKVWENFNALLPQSEAIMTFYKRRAERLKPSQGKNEPQEAKKTLSKEHKEQLGAKLKKNPSAHIYSKPLTPITEEKEEDEKVKSFHGRGYNFVVENLGGPNTLTPEIDNPPRHQECSDNAASEMKKEQYYLVLCDKAPSSDQLEENNLYLFMEGDNPKLLSSKEEKAIFIEVPEDILCKIKSKLGTWPNELLATEKSTIVDFLKTEGYNLYPNTKLYIAAEDLGMARGMNG